MSSILSEVAKAQLLGYKCKHCKFYMSGHTYCEARFNYEPCKTYPNGDPFCPPWSENSICSNFKVGGKNYYEIR